MKISVAMCTYNGSAYIGEQLESIAAQTRLPDELVVCDDRSTDQTIEIVRSFAAVAPFPVRLIVNETTLRVAGNFEKAVSLCAGDVIALTDQDDVWMPEKLAIYEREFTEKPHLGLIFTDGEVVDENLNSLNRRIWDYFFSDRKRRLFEQGREIEVLIWNNTVTGATVALRKELKKRLVPVPLDCGFIHDGWFALFAACHSHIGFVPQPLIKYRQHTDQQCGVVVKADDPYHGATQKEKHRQILEIVRKRLQAVQMAFYSCERQFEEQQRLGVSEPNNEDEIVLKPLAEARSGLNKAVVELSEMIKHLERRKDLPAARWRRLKIVSNELLTGNYFRYSKGFGSALKDLVESF